MPPKTNHQSVEQYIAAQPVEARSVLQQVRATIRKALPDSAEGISYQIPVYKLEGRMVLYFAGFQHHYSIYPATAHVVGALKDELAGFLHSKATIRFPYEERIPTRLITRIAKLRASEVGEAKPRTSAKKAASSTARLRARRKRARPRPQKR